MVQKRAAAPDDNFMISFARRHPHVDPSRDVERFMEYRSALRELVTDRPAPTRGKLGRRDRVRTH